MLGSLETHVTLILMIDQIEEALKLYQNALKLHSQGSDYYDEAEIAYSALFQSEIFTYLESLSESRRLQIYGFPDVVDNGHENTATGASVSSAVGVDGAPSTLPQILYLSYKNHGQFILDRLKNQILQSQQLYDSRGSHNLEDLKHIEKTVSSSLDFFTEALDRDDTDLDLWRQISKLGGFLGSKRIERFCLEAVLDGNRSIPDGWEEPLGLEESFTIEQLKDLIHDLRDHVSEAQLSVQMVRPKAISKSLRKYLDPCPYLPVSSQNPSARSLGATVLASAPKKREIVLQLPTWASCGKAILLELSKIAQGVAVPEPGVSHIIVLPANQLQGSEPVTAKGPEKVTAGNALSGSKTAHLRNGTGIVAAKSTVVLDDANAELLSPDNLKPKRSQNDGTSSLSVVRTEHLQGLEPSSADFHKPNASDKVKNIVLDEGKNMDGDLTKETNTLSGGNTISLPTRKRSSEVAGIQEPVDSGRSRSKRIKARISIAEPNSQEVTQEDLTSFYEEQLRNYTQADHWMFERSGTFLSTLDAQSLGSLVELKRTISMARSSEERGHIDHSNRSSDVVAQDFRSLICSWDLAASDIFLQRASLNDLLGGADGGSDSGLAIFLEHSKRGPQHASQRTQLAGGFGLEDFSKKVNECWAHLDQVSLMWIEELLRTSSGDLEHHGGSDKDSSAYTSFLWPDILKETVVQILVKQDEFLFASFSKRIIDLDDLFLGSKDGLSASDFITFDNTVTCVIQSIFELHLDIYGRITNPSSEVDLATRTLQLDRLGRWAGLARDAYSKRPLLESEPTILDLLSIRFLWSSVVHINLIDPSSRDHILLCFEDLKCILEAAGSPVIDLPNNAIIPEISIDAVEREVSWLTTMDFFLNIFYPGNNDPLTIIESLEPMLEKSLVRQSATLQDGSLSVENAEKRNGDEQDETSSSGTVLDQKLNQMLQFLDKATITLKLFLWRKLGRAYEAINYTPQILSCDLRCLELIMEYFRSAAYTDCTIEIRRDSLLRWLRIMDDLVARILTSGLNDPLAFECVDRDHLQASIEALAALQRILHVFALWEDSVRISQTLPPSQISSPAATAYSHSKQRLRNMLVRTWTLQYVLLKEAVTQAPEIFETPNEDLADYLKIVHHALGLRCYCKESNKIFLRLMKAELHRLQPLEDWEMDLSQVLCDIYGLKICPTYLGSQDHGSPAEPLSRHTAIDIMDFVMIQANRINIKDLMKSDLRFAIEKMHHALNGRRETSPMKFNRHLFNKYLRAPINPVFIYRALRGIGDLSGTPVRNEDSFIADKGWFFLQGHIALAKYRLQKRTSQGPVDDLDNASAFFRQDIEFNMEKWETWYRLGQVYDAKIEEDTTWNAEKLNNHIEDLNILQRNVIHCYTMAVAVAKRCADASFETLSKLSDLYADFGTRIYSSSREPFSMGAFSLENYGKHYNGEMVGMYKNRPFRGLELYATWRLASVLFQEALVHKPRDWM